MNTYSVSLVYQWERVVAHGTTITNLLRVAHVDAMNKDEALCKGIRIVEETEQENDPNFNINYRLSLKAVVKFQDS